MHLYEPFVFRPAGVNVLQLVLVVQVALVVEILGSRGALLHAGAALDADAPDLGHVRRVDGAHGTQLRAQAAAAAPGAAGSSHPEPAAPTPPTPDPANAPDTPPRLTGHRCNTAHGHRRAH